MHIKWKLCLTAAFSIFKHSPDFFKLKDSSKKIVHKNCVSMLINIFDIFIKVSFSEFWFDFLIMKIIISEQYCKVLFGSLLKSY